jgi:purine-binding chemotaxis protein CheW
MCEQLDKNQGLSFKIGRERYPLPVSKIREITPYIRPIPVPGAHDQVEGILNIRGNVITIVSARMMLLDEQDPAAKQSRITLMDMESEPLDTSIDQVGDIISFLGQEIEKNIDKPIQGTSSAPFNMGGWSYCSTLMAMKEGF